MPIQQGIRHRSLALVVFDCRVSLRLQKDKCALRQAVGTRRMQRGPSTFAPVVNVRSSLYQVTNELWVVFAHGDLQRREAFPVVRVDISPVVQENADNLPMSFLGRPVKRPSVALCRIGIGAVPYGLPRAGKVTALTCLYELLGGIPVFSLGPSRGARQAMGHDQGCATSVPAKYPGLSNLRGQHHDLGSPTRTQ